MVNTRAVVLDMLIEILEKKKPSHVVISEGLNRYSELSDSDRSFIKKVCQGTTERKITIDYIIDKVSSVKTAKQKPPIRNILRMGVYQLVWLNVPDSAACNEAVKLVKKRNMGNLSGFVNAVLRKIAVNKAELTNYALIEDEVKRISIEYSVPEWLAERWSSEYGSGEAEKAFKYFLGEQSISIRTNISNEEPEALKNRLINEGVTVKEVPGIARAFRISEYGALSRLTSFNNGEFMVQDVSSILAGDAAEVKGNEQVLDICAAPGGKSLNIADLILYKKGNGHVTSCDISDNKTALIKQNVTRSGFNNITVSVKDATAFEETFRNAFDIVIADVPCSGLGIIGKKPDIKYNMDEEHMAELVSLQRKILDNAVKYVKKGGTLIYSTCTVNRAENEDNVAYIESISSLRRTSLEGVISAQYLTDTSKNGMLQLIPGKADTDGFFIARLTDRA